MKTDCSENFTSKKLLSLYELRPSRDAKLGNLENILAQMSKMQSDCLPHDKWLFLSLEINKYW